jgi:hypothetical protein
VVRKSIVFLPLADPTVPTAQGGMEIWVVLVGGGDVGGVVMLIVMAVRGRGGGTHCHFGRDSAREPEQARLRRNLFFSLS